MKSYYLSILKHTLKLTSLVYILFGCCGNSVQPPRKMSPWNDLYIKNLLEVYSDINNKYTFKNDIGEIDTLRVISYNRIVPNSTKGCRYAYETVWVTLSFDKFSFLNDQDSKLIKITLGVEDKIEFFNESSNQPINWMRLNLKNYETCLNDAFYNQFNESLKLSCDTSQLNFVSNNFSLKKQKGIVKIGSLGKNILELIEN
ncbi:MAG: hypothetical protein SNJ77_04245 [Cytophagales bacterium]